MCIKIKPLWKTTFIGAFVMGMIAHAFALTNNLLTLDSMYSLYSTQDILSSGRQFLTYACGISSYYNLPWLNGTLAIFWLSLCAVVIVECFKIENKYVALSIAAVLMAFPSVVSTMCYIYTIDGYMLALLISLLAFLVTDRKKNGFWAGMVLLGISIGIYQAYFSVVIVLCICSLLVELIFTEKIRPILLKAARYVLMGVGGYAFYVVTLKLMMAIKPDVAFSGYQGTNLVTGNPFVNIKEGLVSAYKTFFDFVLHQNILHTNSFMKVSIVVFFLCGAVAYVFLLIKKKTIFHPIRMFLTAFLVAVIPIGATIVCVLSPNVVFHTLMRMPWVILFVFSIILVFKAYEEFSADISKKNQIRRILICSELIAAFALYFCFTINANIVYFNLNERYEKTYWLCSKVADLLFDEPEYRTGDVVAILGGYPSGESLPGTEIARHEVKDYMGATGDYVVTGNTLTPFCEHYLGVTINLLDNGEYLFFSDEFQDMPYFPSKGCVKKIDGVWVVKFNG